MVLLDVSRLIWRRWAGRLPTGIDRVCLAYLREFGGEAQAVVQRGRWRRILSREQSLALFALLGEERSDFRRRLTTLFLARPAAWRRDGSASEAIYFNLGHTGLDEPSLAPWIAQHRLKAVTFVHDLIPITHPEYCRAGEGERHRRRMETVLASAAGVIGNSQDTLDSLARYAAEQGKPMPPSLAAPLGCDLPSRGAGATAEAGGKPTFVMLGTIEGRKNHLFLLQLWQRMASELGEATPRLVIIGQRGWESEQASDLLDRAEGLRGHVVELGRCSDADLARHLSGARALLFPSLVEGYGLPLIEALHQGTPVIASDLAVFREIGGGVPELLDPLDGPAWRRTILDYAQPNSTAYKAQLARLGAYRAPTWAAHFAAVRGWLGSF